MSEQPAQGGKPLSYRTYGRSHAVRLDGFDYTADVPVHLILSAHVTMTADPHLCRLISDSVEFYCNQLAFDLFGYCLMPDHLHVLLSPGQSGLGTDTWLQRFKSFTGKKWAAVHSGEVLWQRSAYDHVCRKGETAQTVLTYIVNNPVRRGLIGCWTDWPWTKVFVDL